MLVCGKCGAEANKMLDRCACGESSLNSIEVCGNCRAVTTRITLKATADGGKPLPVPLESCPNCDGSTDAIRSVTDRKLWQGHEVYSEHYKKTEGKDGETVYKASDTMIQDLVDEWSKDPDEEKRLQAEAWKRRNRRTKPLSRVEIEQALNEIEANRVAVSALEAGLVLPE